MRRVGIKDVARVAGVSVGTVSNVVNARTSVAEEYVLRVQAAIDELGFVTNDSARQLKAGSSSTVGLVVLSGSNPFFASLGEEVETVAEEHGLSALLASSAQQPERERRYVELFERQRVRGLLVAPIAGTPEYLSAVHQRGTPVIVLGESAGDGFCWTMVDTELGGYLAARHLLASGRRRIAFVGGPRAQVRDRIEGAQRAVNEFAEASLRVIDTNDLTMDEGRTAGEWIGQLPENERPDGVFAANDVTAIGVLNALIRHEHLSIPQDIAVVGHDDIDVATSTLVPLTTIRQPIDLVARAGLDLLVREAEEGVGHVHSHSVLAPSLVIRDSAP